MSQKKNLSVALVVGPKSQMKKKFLESQKLFDRRIPIKKLEMYQGSSHDIVLIKPQGFEMDSSSREKSFINFHSILDLGFRSLNMIFYVVKFDRIDYMKSLITPFLVKFRKHLNEITLVVTGIDLSNKQEYDRELLIENVFKFFHLKNYIICGSTEDISQYIIEKVIASHLQLDLNTLNLLPAKVDQEKLKYLCDKFNCPPSVIVEPSKPIYPPQDTQKCKSPDLYPKYVSDPKIQQQKQPQSQIVGSSTQWKNQNQMNSSQQAHISNNQRSIQQMSQSMQNKKQK